MRNFDVRVSLNPGQGPLIRLKKTFHIRRSAARERPVIIGPERLFRAATIKGSGEDDQGGAWFVTVHIF